MKPTILQIAALITFSGLITRAQTTYDIVTTGSFTYSPSEKTINVGDKIAFSASGFHPLVEVTEATWASTESPVIPKPNGFSCTTNCTITFSAAGTYFFECGAHGPGGMKGKITVVSPTGIEESNSVVGDFKVYPNPAESNVTINLNQNSFVNNVSVINSNGEVVVNNAVNEYLNAYNLNLKNLESGLYQVVVSTSVKKLYSKVVLR